MKNLQLCNLDWFLAPAQTVWGTPADVWIGADGIAPGHGPRSHPHPAVGLLFLGDSSGGGRRCPAALLRFRRRYRR